MKRALLVVCLCAIGAWYACSSSTSDDTGAAVLQAFGASDCKKQAPSALYAQLASALMTGVDGATLDGLQCISWELGGSAKFDLLNFASVCGATWTGKAALAADGTITLTVNNPTCAVAGCGSCIYDWSYTVQGVHQGADVALDVDVIVCDREGETANNQSFSLLLPAAGAAKGLVCRYADHGALEWQAYALGTAGRVFMPCVDPARYPDDGGAIPPCDDGLACTPMRPGESPDASICLKTCAADADCPLPGLVSCQDGLCKLTAPW